MSVCNDCGVRAISYYGEYGGICLCGSCANKRYQEKVVEKSKTLKQCSDLKEWESEDMSELFWIHLGKYIKEPNPDSIKYISMAFSWACHDNHALANSFSNAMKWAKLDLYKEQNRWRSDA